MGRSTLGWAVAGALLVSAAVAPVIATRLHAPLGGKWGFGVYGDLGSFGVVSDLSWQLMANIHYQISDHWVLGVGWRHFEAEQDKDGFKVDLAIDGPFLGASYRF
jgi:opacity protein-like surface antigen